MKKIYINKDKTYIINSPWSCVFLSNTLFGEHCTIQHECDCDGDSFPRGCPLEDA